MDKNKSSEEWFDQANYDIDTAKAMFKAGRYIYTIFMCHLSIEKALKGIYAKRFNKNSPKTHDLSYLCEEIKLKMPEKFLNFSDELNDLSVPTRYPDELKRLLKQYKKTDTGKALKTAEELLAWLRKQ